MYCALLNVTIIGAAGLGFGENLDRRRLEAAHFKYAALKVTSWHPDTFSCPLSFGADLSDFFLPAFHTSLPEGIPPQILKYIHLPSSMVFRMSTSNL